MGKGNKECLVFFGEDVIEWLLIYIKIVRLIFVSKVFDVVFLSKCG